MEEWGTIITTITTILPFPTNQRQVMGDCVWLWGSSDEGKPGPRSPRRCIGLRTWFSFRSRVKGLAGAAQDFGFKV